MSEEAAPYAVTVKRKPVAVRLSEEVIHLGRSMARTKYGSEVKLGNLIEEAIMNLSANSEDETRATALLQKTEDKLIKRISDLFESIFEDLTKRDNKMVERVAGLHAVSAFETCLVELMLKDRFIKSSNDKARYEELRSAAAARMKDRFLKAGAEQIAELHEQNQALQKRIEDLEALNEELKNVAGQHSISLAKANENIDSLKSKLSAKEREISMLQQTISEYERLVSWYEARDNEVPQIQDQNKTLGSFKQSYKKAALIFEQRRPKPPRPGKL